MMKKPKHKLGDGDGVLDRAFKRAQQMPPLAHNNGQPFDIMQSAAAAWLSGQIEFRQSNFDWAKKRGAIVYDKATGTWKGAASE